ncbi:MAG: low-specificity L-threonine aldolase [Ginsengibacter sp.]
MIDYRSDTFTKPTPAMLEAMMKAPVGDDVFREDPTVNKLEALMAEKFGMESGLFCPSGTMTNQIAIKCHTQPGNEVICDSMSHVYIYEGGGIAFNSGCQVKPLSGNRGRINARQVMEAINPNDIHKAPTKLVSLENTANRGGGSCYDLQDIKDIKDVCLEFDLKLHLDGARVFNAIVKNNEDPKQYGQLFDSISICLSKGLGAPVGSVLIGSSDFINRARRVRKVFGGGMRQAGIIAAAGIYALENNIERLATDHKHAKQIADCLKEMDFVGDIMPLETNILIFEVKQPYTPVSLKEKLALSDIRIMDISPTQIRMVLHLDIDEDMVHKTIDAIKDL